MEGNSIHSTIHITGVAKNTLAKLLQDIGRVCEQYHDKVIVNLPCKRMQAMRFGHSVMPNRKMFPQNFKGNSAMVMFGRG